MKLKKNQTYAAKHSKNAEVDAAVEEKIRERARNEELPCAVAFDIAAELGCDPSIIGKTADLMNYRLVKCQLGLFGYQPEKKIVGPEQPSDAALAADLQKLAERGVIACEEAWELAARHRVPKMTVSKGCEALQIKIKPCQLGAF